MEISISEVARTLQARVAYIPGGRSKEGHPVVVLPECPDFATISDVEFVKLMTYLVRVPSQLEFEKGFVIIIDRRCESWGLVKSALVRIAQGYFPGVIYRVYVIKPKGFLQNKLSEFRFRSFKEDFKFNIVLCDSLQDLHKDIDSTQLTRELGGSLTFDLTSWIEDRMAIERFANNCRERSSTVQHLVDELRQTELPNDVESATVLLMDQRKKHMEVKDDLQSAVKYGKTLLRCLQRPYDGEPEGGNADENTTISAIQRLISELEERELDFQNQWVVHERKLVLCIKVRRFEVDFKEVFLVVENLLFKVEEELDLGTSQDEASQLLQAHGSWEQECQEQLQSVNTIKDEGLAIIDEYCEDELVESIRPKCEELKTKSDLIKTELDRRKMVLQKSVQLHKRIRMAQEWCDNGMKVLASQDLDKCQTKEGAVQHLKEIDVCLQDAKNLQLSDPKEFRNKFEDILNSKAKENVRSSVARMEDVKTLFEKRQEILQSIITKVEKPPTPPPVAITATSKSAAAATHLSRSAISENKRVNLPVPSAPSGRSVSPFRNKKNKKNRQKKTDRTIEIVREDLPDIGHSSDSDFPDEDTNSVSFKRKQVMKELIETEKIYVRELESVLRGYIHEMDNPDLQPHIPEILLGKKDILFSNWEDLSNFHQSTFLVELETYKQTPTLVGKCFVERKDDFDHLYSVYCQNKPRSEMMRRECGNNTFFQECQKALNHKLPLSAYLLKPVQRITKYQLLLREMLRYSATEEGAEDLEIAVNCMLTVLKYVNDSMHQVAITGFEGKLSDQGKLLMQGALFMWVEFKNRHNLKDIRQKKMQRHVFLYEKMVLFCKKRGDFKDKTCYAYKTSIKTDGLGVTEHVKGDKRKFELWIGGRVVVYTFQASTEADKVDWVKAVRQALLQGSEQERTFSASSKEQNLSAPEMLNSNGINNNMSTVPSPTTSDSSSVGYSSNNPSINSEQSLDNEEVMQGWATDESQDEFSESDDDTVESKKDGNIQEQSLANKQYVVLADYNQVTDQRELVLQEGDIVEVQRNTLSDQQ